MGSSLDHGDHLDCLKLAYVLGSELVFAHIKSINQSITSLPHTA